MGAALAMIARYGYAIVFGSVFAEQIGLPFPSEPFLMAAGGMVGAGHLDPMIILALAGIASLAGDTAWYWIGRAEGRRVIGWLSYFSAEPGSFLTRAERALGGHGARVLLVAKFVPGFSTIAPPLAGVVGMPLREFMVFSGIGGVAWAAAYVGVGWLFSSELERVAALADRLGNWLVALVAAAGGAYIVWKLIARVRRPPVTSPPRPHPEAAVGSQSALQ